MTPTNGLRPKTGDAPLRVQFRSGIERTYDAAARRLRFTDTGQAFDIVAVERVKPPKGN